MPPRDPGRFTPDLYPDGPPLEPAVGDPPDPEAALAALVAANVPDAGSRFADPALEARAPDPLARAGLVALAGTVAAPLLDAFVGGALTVDRVEVAVPASAGRIVGPRADAPSTTRAVNARYAAEHPVLFAGSLAHDLLWSGPGAGDVEETALHALCAMVHVQCLARAPQLADHRTELARRQHSLAITLLNSRHPGEADITLVAPDGPGTLPGGAPAMQTPDFWSVPFGPDRPSTEPDAPPLLERLLVAVLGERGTWPDPLRYDDSLTETFTHPLGRGWLDLDDQYRVAAALGLLASDR